MNCLFFAYVQVDTAAAKLLLAALKVPFFLVIFPPSTFYLLPSTFHDYTLLIPGSGFLLTTHGHSDMMKVTLLNGMYTILFLPSTFYLLPSTFYLLPSTFYKFFP